MGKTTHSRNRLTTEQFKAKIADTHPNLEVLSEYETTNKPITVRCKIHDYTYVTTPHRLIGGLNCSKCYEDRRGKTLIKPLSKLLDDIKNVHKDNYTFPDIETEYKNSRSKITAICKHGHIFKISVNKLLAGHGCAKCADIENGKKKRLPIETFIERSNKMHDNKYDYSKVSAKYKHLASVVPIICPEHGEFKQQVSVHMNGSGCPICNESHLERDVAKLLPSAERWKRFEWLGRQSLDFYIPNENVAIECQGSQHFTPSIGFGGEEEFRKIIERDRLKSDLCEENNVKLIYVTYSKYKKLINNDLYNNRLYYIDNGDFEQYLNNEKVL